MRYKCEQCNRMVKDKFIFGLLHICLSEEEIQYRERMRGIARKELQASSPQEFVKAKTYFNY